MSSAALAPARREQGARHVEPLRGQLSIDDELGRPSLHRLGEGPELGRVLLEPLLAKGWRLHKPFMGFAGEGFVFILERGGVEVRRTGWQLADVATDLFKEAARMTPWDGDQP